MFKKECLPPLKNFLILLLASPLYTLAPTSLKDLQTSVVFVDGLGSKTQTVKHITKLVVQLTAATFLSKRFGVKNLLIISTLVRCVFPIALLFPTWYVLFPSAVLDGMAAAPMSSTRYSYTMDLIESFSAASGKKLFAISSLFFGALNFTNSLGHMMGCLFSYFVLYPKDANSTLDDDLKLCGSSFCDDTAIVNISRFKELPRGTSYSLYGGFAGCMFVSGLLLLIFLDPEQDKDESKTNSSVAKVSLVDTLKVFGNKFYLLLSPTSIFKGMMAGFVSGEFSKAYVSCTFGVHEVGLVLLLFTIMDCAGSFVSSFVNSQTCRVVSLSFAYISTAAILMTLLIWIPRSDEKYILFLSAGIMGFSNAIVRCQLTSFYGLLFSDVKEAGFNMFAILEDLGEILAWAYSSYLCVDIKLYILGPFLLLGLFGYVLAEFAQNSKRKRFSVSVIGA